MNINKLTWFLSLFLIVLTASSMKGQITIKGVIKDQNGLGLPIVTILEQNTSNGTNSDFDGNFEMQVKDANAIIEVSSIGYKKKTILVGDQRIFEITLEEDVAQLDEVVVVGYGSVKKSDLTGSVASVKMEDLPAKPSNSVDGLLQGQVAGVQVTASSDDPGAGATIRIRGGSSLRGGNDPLVVVDGFPIGTAGDLKQISPQDIESMEVLKDASASAIYGSRGANGVIMITTKKGKKEKQKLPFLNKIPFLALRPS
ncbi:TonB-dependent receptor plug domain-containing protein [Ochrovirga pacifica]|uniref:TonB-dependent receptor plug domain-containing protein n=1 Tax=Ochrovirga pacifica TaxID=1042376 RepID=UPI00293469E4|nr:TonB-dependent receptor plug domain-containing protein [Ochrovirga pacifica]